MTKLGLSGQLVKLFLSSPRGRFGEAVTAFVTSTKLSYVEPG